MIFCRLGMGENNAAWNRKLMLHRETLMAAAAIYKGKSFLSIADVFVNFNKKTIQLDQPIPNATLYF